MSEKLLEEYDIDFDDIEKTIKSLKISSLFILDKDGNTVLHLPRETIDSKLIQIANALMSLLGQIDPWTMVESDKKKIYIYRKDGKIVVLETLLSEEEFENLKPIIDALLDEKIRKKPETPQ